MATNLEMWRTAKKTEVQNHAQYKRGLITNSTTLDEDEAKISEDEGRHQDNIDALNTTTELIVYDVIIGWVI